LAKTNFNERLRIRGFSLSYLAPLLLQYIDRQILINKVTEKFNNKKGVVERSRRLDTTILLPKLDKTLSLRAFFCLPPKVTSHPYFKQVHGECPLIDS